MPPNFQGLCLSVNTLASVPRLYWASVSPEADSGHGLVTSGPGILET